MRLRVQLFAGYREIVGAHDLAWTAKEGETLGDVVAAIVRAYPRLAVHRDTMLLAVNQSFASPGDILHEGDEIALLPPVSGGAS